jgi:methyl-accepting chemotaxis protein
MTAASLTHIPGASATRARYSQEIPVSPVFALSAPTAQPTLEDRLITVTTLLDQLAEGVHELLAEAPTTARRLDEVEGKVDHLVAGLSELLAATQRIAKRMDEAFK